MDRGIGTVMPSYSSLDVLGDGQGPVKMHARADMINGVLKDRMGFDGFVISDWNAIDQIPGDYASDVTHVGQRRRRHDHGPVQLPGLQLDPRSPR